HPVNDFSFSVNDDYGWKSAYFHEFVQSIGEGDWNGPFLAGDKGCYERLVVIRVDGEEEQVRIAGVVLGDSFKQWLKDMTRRAPGGPEAHHDRLSSVGSYEQRAVVETA